MEQLRQEFERRVERMRDEFERYAATKQPHAPITNEQEYVAATEELCTLHELAARLDEKYSGVWQDFNAQFEVNRQLSVEVEPAIWELEKLIADYLSANTPDSPLWKAIQTSIGAQTHDACLYASEYTPERAEIADAKTRVIQAERQLREEYLLLFAPKPSPYENDKPWCLECEHPVRMHGKQGCRAWTFVKGYCGCTVCGSASSETSLDQ